MEPFDECRDPRRLCSDDAEQTCGEFRDFRDNPLSSVSKQLTLERCGTRVVSQLTARGLSLSMAGVDDIDIKLPVLPREVSLAFLVGRPVMSEPDSDLTSAFPLDVVVVVVS